MAVNRNTTGNLALAGGEVFIKGAGETEFQYFGTSDDYKYSFKSETITHSNTEGNAIVEDMELVKSKSATVSLTSGDLNKKVMSMAFGGDFTDASQASGSVSGEAHNGVVGGNVYDLDYVEISNVVVSYTDDGGNAAVAVENVDYSVNYKFGNIEIAKGGSIDGEDITVDYDYAQTTVTTYGTLNKTSDEVSLKFVGNPQHGKSIETIAHRVRLSMNGDYDLKSLDKFMKITFTGKILEDSTQPDGQKFVKTVSLDN